MEVEPTSSNTSPLCKTEFYSALSEIASRVLSSEVDLKELGVSKPTLWRWSTRTNKDLPSPHKVLKLLIYDSGLDKVELVADYYGGSIKKFLNVSFPSPLENEKSLLKNDEFLKDKFDFYIYFLCGTERGVKQDELEKVFGKIAAKESNLPEDLITPEMIQQLGNAASSRVQRLIDMGVIKLVEDTYLKRTDLDLNINTERVQKLSLELTKDFAAPEDFSTGLGAHYAAQESIDRDTAARLTQMVREFILEAHKLMKTGASDSEEAIPFTISALAARLVGDLPQESEVLQ